MAAFLTLALLGTSLTSVTAAPVVVRQVDSKMGYGGTDTNYVTMFSNTKVSWTFNWAMNPMNANYQQMAWPQTNIQYVPMLWGNKDGFFDSWSATASSAIKSGATALMAFNEPDISLANGGSAMQVGDAVAAWQAHMEPFNGQATLISPAVSNSNLAGQGLQWLKSFNTSCTGCHVNAVAVHYYNDCATGSDGLSCGDVSALASYMQQVNTEFPGMDVWLTEFSPNSGSTQDIQNFMSKAVPLLDGLDYVKKYAWSKAAPQVSTNPIATSWLINTAGTALSEVGSFYATSA